MNKIALGIDIGGTNTKIGLVDSEGSLLEFEKFPTKDPSSFADFVLASKQTAQRLVKKLGLDISSLVGVGIGAPNGNAKTGRIESPPNLKHWGTVDLLTPFSKSFNIPAQLDNDANVAALGEGKWGAARGMKDFIVVTLGTGIGTGVVANGELVRGGNGLAGEGGHICIEREGRPCGCGGFGHLEVYGSVRGIKLTVKEILGKELSFAQISDGYHSGDKQLKEAVHKTSRYLGRGLGVMGSLMAPEAFILAGGVATLGEKLRATAEEEMNNEIYPPFKDQIKVLLSDISTGEGAVLGAAGLVL